jgi:hypothetical protein
VVINNFGLAEVLAVQWLAIAVQKFAEDPIEKFIGAFDSGVPD